MPTDADRPAKRSLSLQGHRTSVALEPLFWETLDAMARERGLSGAGLAARIDAARAPSVGLASALRLAALRWALERRDGG